MKRIGILTLQYGLNYGGLLQCYALKEVLKMQGYSPTIIDRIPDGFGKKYVFKRKWIHPITHRDFQGFRKNELKPISKPVHSSSELERLLQNYDACIVGSDQVWRKDVFNVDGDYFFRNIHLPSLNKIAYAASFGVSKWEYNEKETESICAALMEFTVISVREKDGVKLLKDYCKMDAKWVLDPTLLAPESTFISLLKKSRCTAKGKIVTYILDWTPEKKCVIDSFCKDYQKRRIDINPMIKERKSLLSRVFHSGFTVYDWLKLIESADYIITDSFHGTAFSIIFNKQFLTLGNPERGMSRFISLLKIVGLEDRLVMNGNYCDLASIDYNLVNDRIEVQRKECLLFLNKNL